MVGSKGEEAAVTALDHIPDPFQVVVVPLILKVFLNYSVILKNLEIKILFEKYFIKQIHHYVQLLLGLELFGVKVIV